MLKKTKYFFSFMFAFILSLGSVGFTNLKANEEVEALKIPVLCSYNGDYDGYKIDQIHYMSDEWLGLTNEEKHNIPIYIPETYSGTEGVKPIKEIGEYAFDGSNYGDPSEYAFGGKLIIPSNIEIIGDYAFAHGNFTGDLVIPSSVKSIGKNAFVSSGFTGNLIFEENSNLNTIEEKAFYDCTFNGTIKIPNSVNQIGENAFFKMNNIDIVNLPDSTTIYGNKVFDLDTLLISKNQDDYNKYSLNGHALSIYKNNLTYEMDVLFKKGSYLDFNEKTELKLYNKSFNYIKQDGKWIYEIGRAHV